VAIAVAERLRARGEDPVAVSADALQVYEGLGTLTGAPTAEERAQLEHRLVGVVPVTQSFSAGEYAELAHAEIDALLAQGRRPIVVGGTGLYLRAALADLDLKPPPDPEIRERLLAELDEHGPAALHARLPSWAAERVRVSDRQRIVRALELHEAGDLDPAAPDEQLWTAETRHPTALVGLVMEREALNARIDERVDAMVAAGAAEEVARADAAGASPTARKALGFRELLEGDVEAMKRNTRRFAKRQVTWMRKLAGAHLIEITGREPGAVADEVLAYAERS
jgi:tRNA dimethylallyltransferase